MDVKLLSKSKNKLSLRIKGTNAVFINTLRRTIIEEVPTLAIDEVSFVENSSALYDEMLALRLGLVPLKTDLKSYVLPEQAKNETDPRAFLNLKLKATGPKTIYASDIQSQDPKVQPAFPKMVLVKLLKDQQIECEAKAILGKGKTHMKFAPALAYYNNTSTVTVKKKDLGEFKDKYPSQILDKSGKIDPKLINTQKLIDTCKNINPNIIEVEEKPDSFDFTIESWGQLSINDILKQAIKIIDEKISDFEKELKKIK